MSVLLLLPLLVPVRVWLTPPTRHTKHLPTPLFRSFTRLPLFSSRHRCVA